MVDRNVNQAVIQNNNHITIGRLGLHHQEEDKVEVKQESVIQAVATANRHLSDRHLLEQDQEDDEATRRRRERALVRRPSYRKILTELGGSQNMMSTEEKEASESESGGSDEHVERQGPSPNMPHYHPQHGLRVLPSGALLSNGSSVPHMEGLHNLGMNSSTNGGTILQYTTNPEDGGPFFVPTHHNAVPGGGHSGGSGSGHEDTSRSVGKREIRLLKNREAARECRRKKKEYIKCLENRVAVLENQNKALIEELKSLKELYTGGKMM